MIEGEVQGDPEQLNQVFFDSLKDRAELLAGQVSRDFNGGYYCAAADAAGELTRVLRALQLVASSLR